MPLNWVDKLYLRALFIVQGTILTMVKTMLCLAEVELEHPAD